MKFILKPGQLTLADCKLLLDEKTQLYLADSAQENIVASEKVITNKIASKQIIYGINTGFGALANTQIPTEQLHILQNRIVLSHAAGVGDHLPNPIVRLMLALKINSLARGFSGVNLKTVNMLITFFNEKIYPCIPAQGSVGASGDLAPLAHLSAALLGIGEVSYQGKILAAAEILQTMQLSPLILGPKEGLALLNGTQTSTALALYALIQSENLLLGALASGALSLEAARGSVAPLDARIQAVRGHPQQIQVAAWLRTLLAESEIHRSHANCTKVQDPYSLRCQPQVMGACLAQLEYAKNVLIIEANAVSDNPLIFADDNEILSGGNFHAEPVAFVADAIALAIAEIGSLSERRIALLVDPHFSGLPAFLVADAGINSGFMLAQVTAAALVSENKSLAHPGSVDSIPTSANQEDHVSMATYAARRLLTMVDNAISVIGIELLAAAQGIDFLRPLKTSQRLEEIHGLIRTKIPYYDVDRYFAPDILQIRNLIQNHSISKATQLQVF